MFRGDIGWSMSLFSLHSIYTWLLFSFCRLIGQKNDMMRLFWKWKCSWPNKPASRCNFIPFFLFCSTIGITYWWTNMPILEGIFHLLSSFEPSWRLNVGYLDFLKKSVTLYKKRCNDIVMFVIVLVISGKWCFLHPL